MDAIPSKQPTLPQAGTGFEPCPSVPLPRDLQERTMALALNLGLDHPVSGCRIIQMAGINPGDGASSVCFGLAHTVAFRLGRRVLLIEADPPGPDRERLMPAAEPDGQGEDQLLLTALWRSHVAEAPTSVPLRLHLLLRLRSHFDLILIDSNRSALTTDGQLVGSMADGVVMLLDGRNGSMELAAEASNRLRGAGANLLGVVLRR